MRESDSFPWMMMTTTTILHRFSRICVCSFLIMYIYACAKWMADGILICTLSRQMISGFKRIDWSSFLIFYSPNPDLYVFTTGTLTFSHLLEYDPDALCHIPQSAF